MENSATPHEAGTAGSANGPSMSFFGRLVGIYFEPQKTFEDIHRRGSWLGLYILMAVLACASGYTLMTRMDRETYLRKAMAMTPMTKNMSEEQLSKIIEQQSQSALRRYSGIVFAPIGILVAYLICAAAFLLIFILMGAGIDFKKSFTMTLWGMAPPGIVLTLLGILFMFLKDPVDLQIDPSANVVSNLGLLVAEKEHPVLASLLSSIDLFSFWTIFLLATGFAAASSGRMTKGKAATGVIVLWAVWVLGKAGFKAILF